MRSSGCPSCDGPIVTCRKNFLRRTNAHEEFRTEALFTVQICSIMLHFQSRVQKGWRWTHSNGYSWRWGTQLSISWGSAVGPLQAAAQASFSELSGLTGLLYKHRCLKNGFRSSQQLPTRSVAAGWLMAFGVTLSARQWSALAVGNRTKAGDHQREHSCMVLWWIPPPCPQRPDLMAILESLQLLGPKRSRDCKFIATCAKWQEKN